AARPRRGCRRPARHTCWASGGGNTGTSSAVPASAAPGGQHGIYQLEQAILAQALVVVQLLTEGAKSCQQLGICHNPKRVTFAPKPEAPDAPWPLLCPISKD